MPESDLWDASMIDRIRAGDDSALGSIYDRYGMMVHGIASQVLDPDQANDVTQDVFIDLWQHADHYDPDRGSLRGWLALIARRRAIDVLRSAQRRRAREQRALKARPAADRSLEDMALTAISVDRVHAAIGRLPVEQRRAVELAYFAGLTFRDVARVTGAAEGTAKSRLRLDLGRLATELAERGDLAGAAS